MPIMDSTELARQALDRRLKRIRDDKPSRPPRGWIKAIRESLGMTTRQLAARAGLSQPRIVALERAEVTGDLKLSSIEQIARALNCDLVYALVPREPLEDMVQHQAEELAKRRLKAVDHTMLLEQQQVHRENPKAAIKRVAENIKRDGVRKLWDPA